LFPHGTLPFGAVHPIKTARSHGAVTEFNCLVQSRTQRLSNPANSIIEIRATWRIVKFSGATL
jgi:hypothetical protein